MLQLNNAGNNFTETITQRNRGRLELECSFADYNQDGEQDLFVCNGIPKRPNDL
jgi:hypothetical protein